MLTPDPPVLGQQGQICVALNNPVFFQRTVSVDFSVAAFGAGIGFTPVGSLNNIVLPAASFTQHCIDWTPTPVANGNLHRCIQVRLRQAGFVDQYSQRNVDLRRLAIGTLDDLLNLEIPFSIGNTHLFTVPLAIDLRLVGINPLIAPKLLPDPPPDLSPGQELQFKLGFVVNQPAQRGTDLAHADDPLLFGDAARVDVSLYLDKQLAGGFSVELVPVRRLYLPSVLKE